MIMQATSSRVATPSVTGAATVWDLESVSRGHIAHRARPDYGGAIAATLGVVAFCAGVAPPLSIATHWCLVIAFGAGAVLVGFSALRRRQTRAAVLLATLGLLLPVTAVTAVIVTAALEPATVTNVTVKDSSLEPGSTGVVTSPGFAQLSIEQRSTAGAFLTALVLQLQTMHGSWAPFPTSLGVSNGSLVEGSGILRGTTLGTVPEGDRLVYQVSPHGAAFRVAVVATSDVDASIAAESSMQVPGMP